MFVSNHMKKTVITVDQDASVFEAQQLMAEKQIRHLPIVDAENRLLAIVTDRDIRSALPYTLLKGSHTDEEKAGLIDLKVKNIMTLDPKSISPMDTIQDALLLIQQHKVGAFPVINEKKELMGILSVRDLLSSFINVLNINEPGTLLCVLVEEKVGQLKKLVDTITEEGISFGSVLVNRHWEEDKRAVFIYLLTNNVVRVKKKITALGFSLLDPMSWYIDNLSQKE
ncbi:acetoin utilization protein AcuB [Desulfocicer vacuolatum DSM 3385]|uniref:Acetoin utilization protein AcuB n=1 Tax=Desulfocicer vacuolatum DSM 3385 TaxID=1121400 RepID=A0A1W1YN33_9BACT|nr:CBS and ACT domain-containing protein [Desulfocicer vacuolatum]SMC37533.1 acetoin utilization protein AcuB [Desulfocicer vacuolatum DSM 3385]